MKQNKVKRNHCNICLQMKGEVKYLIFEALWLNEVTITKLL
jgi:hypothetical protein